MAGELISRKTRLELREYFVGTSLREIQQEFDAAEIPCASDFTPPVSGQRRALVEQYYYDLDFTNWQDVRKFLLVYQSVLTSLEDAVEDGANEYYQKCFRTLKRWIERDRFRYENGRLLPFGESIHLPSVAAAAADMDAPELRLQLERLRDAADRDPALAIGTAKELVETTCKTILHARGEHHEDNWDIGRLIKETRRVLELRPDDIPDTARGADSIRRLLSNLATVAQGLGELRNLYGTGHGRRGTAKGLSGRHARLAIGAAATLATFLLETHREKPVEEAAPATATDRSAQK